MAACSTTPRPDPTAVVIEPPRPPAPELTWRSAPFAFDEFDEPASMAVRPGDPALYVALTRKGTIWLSNDGLNWREGGRLEFTTNLLSERTVHEVVFSDGRFVAVGSETPPDEWASGLMWTSADGTAWSLRRLGHLVVRALSAEGTLLAGAAVEEGGGFAEYDGAGWSMSQPTNLVQWGMGEPEDLLPIESGFLIAGGLTRPGTDISVANVFTFDGDREWRWLTNESPTGPPIRNLARLGDGFAALGDDDTFWTATAVDRWSAPSELPFAASRLFQGPDGTLLLMGEGIWASVNGIHWTRTDDGSAPTGQWAYAGGAAIGCDDTACRAFVLEEPSE